MLYKQLLVICILSINIVVSSQQIKVFTGGIVVDVSNWGTSTQDIIDSVVVIKGETIIAVGKKGEVNIPNNAHKIDISGKYVVPGLIDCFAVLNNQSYANAFLYCGVTSIVAVWGGRRGPLFEKANPGPTLYKLEGIGTQKISTEKLLSEIEKLAATNHRVVLLMYSLTPDQLKAGIEKAHSLGMSIIGELAATSYQEGIELGIDAYVHTTRYCLDVAPKEMVEGIKREPFSNDLNSPKWKYYKYLTNLKADNPKLHTFAKTLASGVPLVPTFSLLYLDLPNHKNLWKDPVAQILDPKDINNPPDPLTGKHSYQTVQLKAYADLAQAEIMIEKLLVQNGARYLAGSGTDVWGTMPGISMHTELEALKNIGLNNRQVLASATTNTAKTLMLGKIGEIKVGNRADILILDGNPIDDLENLRRISLMLLHGKIVDRQTLLKKNSLQKEKN